MTAGTAPLFSQVSGVKRDCNQDQAAASQGVEVFRRRRAAGRLCPCLLAMLAAACAAEPAGQDSGNNGSSGMPDAPPAQSVEAPEQAEDPVWLRDLQRDQATLDRNRLADGLVSDLRERGYGEELTYHTNAEAVPYKIRSRELLEKAEARAREARASSATASSQAAAPPAAPSGPAETPAASPPKAGSEPVGASNPQVLGVQLSRGATTQPSAAAPSPSAGPPPGTTGEQKAAPQVAARPAEPSKSPNPPAPPPATDPAPGTSAQQKAAARPAEPPNPPDPPAGSAAGPIRIQLASLRDPVAAEREFLRLQARFPEILGGRRLYLEQVDLGDKGLFHRVQFGPFRSRTAAEEACARLRQRQQDCLVVMRRPA